MIDTTRCWIWTGRLRKEDGRAMSGRTIYAYRTVYEAATGEPCPPGVAHHRCENPACVNPEHLEFITQGEHLKGHGLPGDWGQADKTECPSGHPYTAENTYVWRGERQCRECRRQANARYRAKKRI